MTKGPDKSGGMPPRLNMPGITFISPDSLSAIRAASASWGKQFQAIDEAMEEIRKKFNRDYNLDPIRSALESFQKSWRPFFKDIKRHNAAKAPLREAGLLPHITTPWEKFSEEAPENFSDAVFEHYDKNWERVEAQIREEVQAYMISDLAKRAFSDALSCHRNQLY